MLEKYLREPPEILVDGGAAIPGVPFMHVEHIGQRHSLDDGMLKIPSRPKTVEHPC